MNSPKEIADHAFQLCMQIERCGCSPDLTIASVGAQRLLAMIKGLDQTLVSGETLQFEREEKEFREWAVVELMGHLKVVGLCSESTIAGTKLLRVDALNAKGETNTRYFGPGLIYAITPCSEQIARAMASNIGSDPITRFDITSLQRQPIQPGLPYDNEDSGLGDRP